MKMDLEGEKLERRKSIAWKGMKPSGLMRVFQGVERVVISVQGGVAPMSLLLQTSGRRIRTGSGVLLLLDKALSPQLPDHSFCPIFYFQPSF